MASWLPSVPYTLKRGYWLPVTSTINWCEEDYYATIYSAEIVNTITNLLFVLLAVKGAINCYQEKHDRIFLITFAGYATVGTGSMLFHSTLKYPMQLVDELAMIYTTSFQCYASFSHKRSTPYKLALAVFLVGLSVFITAYYHYLQDPLFHQRAYALLTATVLTRAIYVMETTLRPSLRDTPSMNGASKKMTESDRKRLDERDTVILKKMWVMFIYGLAIFLGGFAIWSMDNNYCNDLRRLRRSVGLPWGILLEGHGWWHIMTGIGAYFYIEWGIWLRHCHNGRQEEYYLYWPSMFFSIPILLRSDKHPDFRSRKIKAKAR